jgi:hypothetical protein
VIADLRRSKQVKELDMIRPAMKDGVEIGLTFSQEPQPKSHTIFIFSSSSLDAVWNTITTDARPIAG